MTNSWRFSTLGDRHRALGSNLEDWSGMGTAWSYDADPEAEYLASNGGKEAVKLEVEQQPGLL